ncbi:hypothetical protein [Ferrovibrio sp.]|uniref:hypothetical protein n=1 Tax=Ferrovibrio sp. TaxID=1917215 RepID=UPI0025BF1EC7|nr:hypothetical protein [Ferrovibrio sp.]
MPIERKTKPAAAEPKAGREVSAIGFPYLDLDNAISVARAMIENGGVPCTRDQLAGAMKQVPSSGNFVMKLAAARLFGLIEVNQGKNHLTQNGFAIVDPERQKAARAEAFLTVPLYRRVYEEFRGKQLPPRPLGLEQAFVNFGVPAKQKDKARWTFEKSARQAGFFNAAEDRLVEPILASTGSEKSSAAAEPNKKSNISESSTTSGANLDPLIEGLLRRLPDPGSDWDYNKRVQWLRTLIANLDVVYPSVDDSKYIAVSVEVDE